VPLPPPVQRLPWDFKTTFPQPTDDVVDAGLVDESDLQPENLKAMHEQYAREMLATLRALDNVTDARRGGRPPEAAQAAADARDQGEAAQVLSNRAGQVAAVVSKLAGGV
jgi:hypothetical protein